MMNLSNFSSKKKKDVCKLVERIVRQIVNNPEQVEVREVEGEESIILEISTAKQDTGIIIGKGGRVADALRVVVRAAASQLGKKVTVNILEK